MKDIAIFGAGGFGKEVACLIKMINERKATWNLIGFFDDNPDLKDTQVSHYGKVLGGLAELNEWKNPLDIAITIGNPSIVKKIAEGVNNPHISYPNLIAPTTIFLDKEDVILGKGNIICSHCLISCNVRMGDFNIFNGNIPVGHDCQIGNFNVVMPSVNISGGVRMGDGNFLGVQSVVLQGVKIGNDIRLGANSVLMHHVKDGCLYMGNPAKRLNL